MGCERERDKERERERESEREREESEKVRDGAMREVAVMTVSITVGTYILYYNTCECI